MESIFVIVNPVSANRTTSREWPKFENILSDSGHEFKSALTESPGHGTTLTRNALKAGYKTIMSVGGDGTMNEVVNGFYEGGHLINPDSRLVVFSRGTGCDFIKSLKMNNTIEDLLSVLSRNKEKELDVGCISFDDAEGKTDKRYFLNVADIGIGAETANRVNNHSKLLSGFLSFMLGTIGTVILYKNKNFEVVIDDDVVLKSRMNSVIVANGKYFGGGMMIAPCAVLDDGLFDIIILGDLSKPDIIKSFPLIYKGEHMNHPKLKHYRGKKVIVKSGNKGLIEVDGEIPGRSDAVFELLPKAIKILV